MIATKKKTRQQIEQEQQEAAKEFVKRWKDRGSEKSEAQKFWLDFLQNVMGVEDVFKKVDFEVPVEIEGSTKFIDGYLPDTGILIEQKSSTVNLGHEYLQSDGDKLTPYQQARRYGAYLPYDQRPRWIVVSNFNEIRVHDMNRPNGEPAIIELDELPKELYRLKFLVEERDAGIRRETEISVQAGELVAGLHGELREQYRNPDDPESMRSLNMLCVRLVFCMYAEDSGIFAKGQFRDFLNKYQTEDLGERVAKLFEVLDQKYEDRPPYLAPALADFPYVNGGLFSAKDTEIPMFTEKIRDLLLNTASQNFDWSKISPTIFGAIFESTMNPDERRAGGMHYTSIENIHKVIDPLFLNDLKDELETILDRKRSDNRGWDTRYLNERNEKLNAFREKLGDLVFLDPACGSANFLTETYISLRRLENQAIQALYEGQGMLGSDDTIKVKISQFHGIEINDFAVSVGQTALWIAENQMMKETEAIVRMHLEFLPLTTAAHIVEGNALRLDWHEVVPASTVSFVMGNPPFSAGRRMKNRSDFDRVMDGFPKKGQLDFVTAWFALAAKYMQGTDILAGFIATSSITQGEQVILLWKRLFEEFNISIRFAVQSFKWESEAHSQGGVHCVIVGFGVGNSMKTKILMQGKMSQHVEHINGYLQAAPDAWITARRKPVNGAPIIANGSKPLDGAKCAFWPAEKEDFVEKEPGSAPFFYRYMGSKEFLNNLERYFLWIAKIPPNELVKMPHVLAKLEEVKKYRSEESASEQTRKLAETPMKFHYENKPEHECLVIPQTSSGLRKYIPIGIITPDVFPNSKLQVMRDGGLYELGILSSNVHNAWVRAFTGRFREDFTYSVRVLYNTFPWPEPTPEQKKGIEQTAQGILDARAQFPGASLAALYKDIAMPDVLRKAHQANDRAVMNAYGMPVGKTTESDAIAHLMRMYHECTRKK